MIYNLLTQSFSLYSFYRGHASFGGSPPGLNPSTTLKSVRRSRWRLKALSKPARKPLRRWERKASLRASLWMWPALTHWSRFLTLVGKNFLFAFFVSWHFFFFVCLCWTGRLDFALLWGEPFHPFRFYLNHSGFLPEIKWNSDGLTQNSDFFFPLSSVEISS